MNTTVDRKNSLSVICHPSHDSANRLEDLHKTLNSEKPYMAGAWNNLVNLFKSLFGKSKGTDSGVIDLCNVTDQQNVKERMIYIFFEECPPMRDRVAEYVEIAKTIFSKEKTKFVSGWNPSAGGKARERFFADLRQDLLSVVKSRADQLQDKAVHDALQFARDWDSNLGSNIQRSEQSVKSSSSDLSVTRSNLSIVDKTREPPESPRDSTGTDDDSNTLGLQPDPDEVWDSEAEDSLSESMSNEDCAVEQNEHFTIIARND